MTTVSILEAGVMVTALTFPLSETLSPQRTPLPASEPVAWNS